MSKDRPCNWRHWHKWKEHSLYFDGTLLFTGQHFVRRLSSLISFPIGLQLRHYMHVCVYVCGLSVWIPGLKNFGAAFQLCCTVIWLWCLTEDGHRLFSVEFSVHVQVRWSTAWGSSTLWQLFYGSKGVYQTVWLFVRMFHRLAKGTGKGLRGRDGWIQFPDGSLFTEQVTRLI